MLKLETEVRAYLATLQTDAPKTKEDVRRVLLERKLEQLLMKRKDLLPIEGRALSLMRRVDYSNIKPAMVFCAPKDRDVWNYLRNTVSSAPWTDRPGRAMFLFCMDKATGGIAGIVDLGSDLAILGPRDKYIGWNQERRLTGGGLRHVVNLGTCVAVAPFGTLTGGKFMSVAATAQEIGATWHRRYGDVLAGVTTTSLYGESSQYNRIKEYRYLGETNGGGIATVSERGKRTMAAFLASNDVRTQYGRSSGSGGPGGGFGNTLNKVMHSCDVLGIDIKRLASGQPRGVYFAERGPNALPFLRGETSNFTDMTRTLDEISEWWLDRWYSMRWPKKRDEVQAFSYDVYRVDAQIELCREAIARGPSVEGDTLPQAESSVRSAGAALNSEITVSDG